MLSPDTPHTRRVAASLRLAGACHEALQRIHAKAGPEHDIFGEAGEALGWLYALGNVGV